MKVRIVMVTQRGEVTFDVQHRVYLFWWDTFDKGSFSTLTEARDFVEQLRTRVPDGTVVCDVYTI